MPKKQEMKEVVIKIYIILALLKRLISGSQTYITQLLNRKYLGCFPELNFTGQADIFSYSELW